MRDELTETDHWKLRALHAEMTVHDLRIEIARLQVAAPLHPAREEAAKALDAHMTAVRETYAVGAEDKVHIYENKIERTPRLVDVDKKGAGA